MQIHWHEGLFLQPHHLQALERGLAGNIRTARSLGNPYCFGVLDARLSVDDLADGRIRFERLRAIMPSGQEVNFPAEANLPSREIKEEMLRGNVEVFLAVPLWLSGRPNSFRQGEVADSRVKLLYMPGEQKDLLDENDGDNPQDVPIRKINARLALKGEDFSDMETIPLLRVLRSTEADGNARTDPQYVPPSILLRAAPPLHQFMQDLVAHLRSAREGIRNSVATSSMGLEARWEQTLKLTALNRYCARLGSIVGNGERPDSEGFITPFQLYLQLRELLGELLALHKGERSFDCEAYNHLDPFRSFRELSQKIRAEITLGPENPPERTEFKGQPGRLRAALKPEHFEKPNAYFLGVRTNMDRATLAGFMVNASSFKLMPTTMENVTVQGIEMREENAPPLALPPDNNLYYFRISRDADPARWQALRNAGSASLVWNNATMDLSAASFALYMTLP